jgi:predicted SAM-dependent methyltransferase
MDLNSEVAARNTPSPSPYVYRRLLGEPRWKPLVKRVLLGLRLARWTRRWLKIEPGRYTADEPADPQSVSADHPRRLNLGCGASHYRGYLHADIISRLHLNFQADARRLPLADDVLDEVLCTELLEHLDTTDGIVLLREIARVLRPGGRLILTTPALDLLCRVQQAGLASHAKVMQHLYGDQHDHRALYPAGAVVRLCRQAGLQVERTIPHWGPIWAHLLVLARRPGAG